MTPNPLVPDDVIESLYPSIGMLVISWAFVEQGIDGCIAIIYQSTQGRHRESQLPRSVRRKTSFLKLSHKIVDILKPLAAEGLPTFSEANRLAQIRHTVVAPVRRKHQFAGTGRATPFAQASPTGNKVDEIQVEVLTSAYEAEVGK